MRITNQMLNATARKAGLPIQQTSLLNYVNQNAAVEDTESALLDALNKKSSPAVDKIQKDKYEKLEKAADNLEVSADTLLASGEDSLFEKARKSGENQELYAGIEAFVHHYNETVEGLSKASGYMNAYYSQMLKQAATDDKEALKNIGITMAEDGTLHLDSDKLKAADLETVEKVLGASGTFSAKVAIIAERAADNAKTSIESLSSQYNSKGSTYVAASNKYEFWG